MIKTRTTPHKPASKIIASAPKTTLMHTPVSSNSSGKEEEKDEVVVEISENVEVEEIQEKMSKRNTVIKIPKPKDEKKAVFRKMLLLNADTEN